jgi:hypothetical protein
MDAALHRAPFDWLAETAGATALALAAGYAGMKAAPLGAAAPSMALIAAAAFAIGLLVMRRVPGSERRFALPDYGLVPLDAKDRLDELLLDRPVEETLLLTEMVVDAPLLLDDPLLEAEPGSRVVQLFASPAMPTPGQLRDRIERHLATGAMHVVREFEGPAPDASDALYAALSELRRSLR